MPHYKLTYFNFRGQGETQRLIFAAAGVPYDDVRVDYYNDWPGEHKKATPFGQLPTLEVDGVLLCESNACARYLARTFNLAGKTSLDQARVDMVVDCLADATINPIEEHNLEKDPVKKEQLKKEYLEVKLPTSLTYLENILKSNQGGDKFFVGEELTWADLALSSVMGWTLYIGAEDPLKDFPKLAALLKKVESIPRVAAWIAKRPVTEI